jgi:hypothetical protein
MPFTLPSSDSALLILRNEDHKIWLLECSQKTEHDYSRLAASSRRPASTLAREGKA